MAMKNSENRKLFDLIETYRDFNCVNCEAQHPELIDIKLDFQGHPFRGTYDCPSCGFQFEATIQIPYTGKGA